MATNAASVYGSDVACIFDADELFSGVSGVDLVRQDAIHRLLTDNVLGPGGDGWGYDCRRLLGVAMNKLPAIQPLLSSVLLRDDRIQTANVTITSTTTNGLVTISIVATCTTAAGPFDFVLSVASLTNGTITVQVR